jgi:hypothetical protein
VFNIVSEWKYWSKCPFIEGTEMVVVAVYQIETTII